MLFSTQDYEMHLMLEQCIRGGICQVVKRYDKVNLPNVDGVKYNEKKTQKNI